jgi:hypothetical protein
MIDAEILDFRNGAVRQWPAAWHLMVQSKSACHRHLAAEAIGSVERRTLTVWRSKPTFSSGSLGVGILRRPRQSKKRKRVSWNQSLSQCVFHEMYWYGRRPILSASREYRFGNSGQPPSFCQPWEIAMSRARPWLEPFRRVILPDLPRNGTQSSRGR